MRVCRGSRVSAFSQDSQTSFGIQAILRSFLPDFLSLTDRPFLIDYAGDRHSLDGLALRILGCLLLPQVQQGNNDFWLSNPVTHLSFWVQFPREGAHTGTFWREYWDVYYPSMKHVVCNLFYLQVDRAHHSTNLQYKRTAVLQNCGCTGRPWAQWDYEECFIS